MTTPIFASFGRTMQDGVRDHIPEWHIAVAGLADLCVWLGDAASAAQLYRQLAPCAGLQAMLAHTP
ncbi:MAG TPA: hypothetical protein VIT41_11855, partial [Microlunatus sp.]